MEKISDVLCYEGRQQRFKHVSATLDCEMHFSVFLPPQAEQGKVPVLLWLSGLTCTDENFVTKAGAQQFAAEHGIAVVAPDTSPRGEGVADDSEGAYDLGLGAGFYINATQEPWSRHYRMYGYIVEELPEILAQNLPVDMSRCSISGHSMGGHGALSIALKNPSKYRSVSAFSPIVAPSQCPWGEKAFSNYLGDDRAEWTKHDSVALIKGGAALPPLKVDQGSADGFLQEQLKTELLIEALEERGISADVQYRNGYDHSYFFIASFIGEHMAFHARYLTG